jgi:hypothetical protein
VSEKAPEELQVGKAVPEVEQNENKEEATVVSEALAEQATVITPPPNAWAKPKAWAGLFNPATASSAASSNGGNTTASSFGKSNAESLAEALRSFDAVSNDTKVAFLEPRGLVNTGNMCYMNSVSYNDRFRLKYDANKSLGSASSRILHAFLQLPGSGRKASSTQLQERYSIGRCYVSYKRPFHFEQD